MTKPLSQFVDAKMDRKRFLSRAAKASLVVVGASSALEVLGNAPVAEAADETGRLNLKDYGAVGDGTTNDGPALQKALDDLGANGGGELVIPPGKFVIASTVYKDFNNLAAAIRIVGYGSASQLIIKTPSSTAIELGDLEHVVVQGVTFVGTANNRNDAYYAFCFAFCDDAIMRDCGFYGVASLSNPGSVLYNYNSDVVLDRCIFRGCATAGAVVTNINWVGFRAENCLFLDYGLLGGSKVPLGGGAGWMQAQAPSGYPLNSTNSEGVFTIRNVKCDEGARAVYIDPGSSRIARVHIDGLDSNVPAAGIGAFINKVDELVIENSFFGYTSAGRATDAIKLTGVKDALISRTFCLELANRITADATVGTLTVQECTYTTLNSTAARTNIIKDGRGGVVPKTKEGAISDSDFDSPPQDGTLAVDTANSQLYVRVGGVWKKVALT